jgi:uncharacterized protein
MSNSPDNPPFSATELSHFVACAHLTLLDRAAKLGGPKPPKYNDPALEVLWQRGLQHEERYEAGLREQGLAVMRIEAPPPSRDSWQHHTAATLEAMKAGLEVIVQGGLWHGRWVGKPDFLRRMEEVSTGVWSYDVVDTKLTREAKAGALLQVLL